MKRYTPQTHTCRSAAVLLVDDDPDCRQLFRDALAAGGLDCPLYEVGDGAEALGFLRQGSAQPGAPGPGLIYLDLEMPGLSGQEVLRRLKADPRLRRIPVVILTGANDREHRAVAARSGADGFIVKPVDPSAFVDSIIETTRYWLNRSA